MKTQHLLATALFAFAAFKLTADPSAVSRPAPVTVTVQTEGEGTVAGTPEAPAYSRGTTIQLTAQPATGYVFGGWKNIPRPFRNPLLVTLVDSTNITATFLPVPGVVMENTEASFTGVWTASMGSAEKRRETYHFATSVPEKANAWAKYRPQLSRSGVYDVYVWYAAGANRTRNALWTVTGKTGAITRSINQQTNGGKWVPIAESIELDPQTAAVELSNATGDKGLAVVADAVAFVFISDALNSTENLVQNGNFSSSEERQVVTREPNLATIRVAQ